MAQMSYLDLSLRQLKKAKDVDDIPKLLKSVFASGQNYDACSSYLERMADKVRDGLKRGDYATFSAFASKIDCIPNNSVKADFFADKRNADLKAMLVKDPLGLKARKAAKEKLLKTAREQGAKALGNTPEIQSSFIKLEKMENEIKKRQAEYESLSEKASESFQKLFSDLLAERIAKDEKIAKAKAKIENSNALSDNERKMLEDDIVFYKNMDKMMAESDATSAVFRKRDELDKIKNDQADLYKTTAELIKNVLNKESKITEEEAKSFAENNIKADDGFLEKCGDESFAIAKDIVAQIYRLTGGKLGPITFTTGNAYGDCMRSFTDKFSNTISIAPDIAGANNLFYSTLWHELGHHVEFSNKSYCETLKEFIQSRAISQKIYPLNYIAEQVDPIQAGYQEDECGYWDHFKNIYCGKHYADSTEVLSMGLEGLGCFEESRISEVCEKDYMETLVGILTGGAEETPWASTEREMVDFFLSTEKGDYGTEVDILAPEWKAAIDNAITDEFRNALLSSKEIYGVRLQKVGGKYLITKKEKDRDLQKIKVASLPDALRRCYIAAASEMDMFGGIYIGNPFYREFPDAPEWFFSGRELPKIEV